MHFLALWHYTYHSRNKSKSSSLGNGKVMTSCFDFLKNLWDLTNIIDLIPVWKIVHADWELVLATSFGFLGFGLGSMTHLSSEEAWDDPSLIFLDKSLAPFIPIFCLAFRILSFPGFLFFLSFFYLVSLLADLLAWWWILCMAIVIPLLADKIRLIRSLATEDQESVPQAQWCSFGLDCPQAYTRSEQQACPNMKSGFWQLPPLSTPWSWFLSLLFLDIISFFSTWGF